MKIKEKTKRKSITLLAAGILAFAMTFSTFAKVMEPAGEDEDKTADKLETVYAVADAEGNVKEMTVETVIKNPGNGDPIEDYSTLKNIRNTEGDETFTDLGNGVIIWENHGEDIKYEGKSDKKLPFSVKISYYLDNEPISPDALAGQSGRLRMRFDYKNLTSESVEIDGKMVTVQVPFVFFSTAFLPADVFSDIRVTNGKVMMMNDENVVFGIACPGVADSLKLMEYEPTKDIELPDYVEITADVVNFELAFTATVATTGAFSDMNIDDLNDVDDFIDNIEKLKDGSTELAGGMSELFEGVETFRSGFSQYREGVGDVGNGIKTLKEGLAVLNEEKVGLETGVDTLCAGLERLNDAMEQMTIPSEGDIDMSALTVAVQALAADARALGTALDALYSNISQIQALAGQAAAYSQSVRQASDGAANQLDAVDLNGAEAAATAQAREQAEKAVGAALEDIDLSDEEKAAIREKVISSICVNGTTAEIESHISAAEEKLGSIAAFEIPELAVDTGDIMDVVSDMQNHLADLTNYADVFSEMARELLVMGDSLDALKTSVARLTDGSKQLTKGIAAFNQGIAYAYEGSLALNDGTQALASAGGELNKGLDVLSDGTQVLCDSVRTFDEEGIGTLSDLAGENLEEIMIRLKALKEVDSQYNHFAGIGKNQMSSVKFVLETDKIQ